METERCINCGKDATSYFNKRPYCKYCYTRRKYNIIKEEIREKVRK